MLARTRADPALKARLARAAAWGRQFRPRHDQARFFYDYDRVDAFLEVVRAGEPVRAMQLAGRAPDQATIRAWKASRPDFVARYAEAKRLGRLAREARARRPFDPALADRILARVHRGDRLADILREPGMPGPTALRRWKAQDPGFAAVLAQMKRGGQIRRARARRRGGPTPELADAIGRGLAMGASVTSLCRDADMPSRNTVAAWRRRDPAFDRTVAEALRFRDMIAEDRRFEAEWAAACAVGGPRTTRTTRTGGAG
ncbi:MAG: hypothetical protein JNK30_14455 [Phenylobacterium sp.]|nr:hypothetical protein [Phenylobacterium sp.]